MDTTYTSKEIIEMAIQAKEKGVELYMALARNSENYHVSQLFAEFAKDEEHHKLELKKWIEEFDVKRQEEAYPGEKALYLKAMVDAHAFNCDTVQKQLLGTTVSEEAALQAGITFEKDFMLFLHELKQHLAADEDAQTIDALLDDEARHLREMFNLKEKVDGK